jgi:hypothetical protein
MQVIVMLAFLAVWMLVLWAGSIAFEATGLPRSQARFQALSALSGTGFTTREAESIVNHPRRRRIAIWLILLGNVGIVAFLILIILYVRAGLAAPPLLHIIVLAAIIIVFILAVWTGLVRRVSDFIVGRMRRGRGGAALTRGETLYEGGGYAVVRLVVDRQAGVGGMTLEETGLAGRNVAVLALEKGDQVVPNPEGGTPLAAGDGLLCYGRLAEIEGFKS